MWNCDLAAIQGVEGKHQLHPSKLTQNAAAANHTSFRVSPGALTVDKLAKSFDHAVRGVKPTVSWLLMI